jgi:hypothetical protein
MGLFMTAETAEIYISSSGWYGAKQAAVADMVPDKAAAAAAIIVDSCCLVIVQHHLLP